MSRKSDLERLMRESVAIVHEYERTIQTSDRPEERLRAQREVERQWGQIERGLAEYRRLAGGAWPADVAEMAAHFTDKAPAATDTGLPPASTVFDQRGQHVGTQINVAGDIIDRRRVSDDEEQDHR